MVKLELNTKRFSDKQTIGWMDVYKNNVYQFSLATLEQEWNNNVISNSCIPPGFYIVEHCNTKKHPNSFLLKGTEPRTAIMIHILNFMFQTEGCIGVGLYHEDINADGYPDLVSSGKAMDKLRAICKNEKTIFININR